MAPPNPVICWAGFFIWERTDETSTTGSCYAAGAGVPAGGGAAVVCQTGNDLMESCIPFDDFVCSIGPCPKQSPTEEEKTTNRQWQSCLAYLGYYKGPMDGIWGESSQSAWDVALESYFTSVQVYVACYGWTSTPPE